MGPSRSVNRVIASVTGSPFVYDWLAGLLSASTSIVDFLLRHVLLLNLLHLGHSESKMVEVAAEWAIYTHGCYILHFQGNVVVVGVNRLSLIISQVSVSQ